jgi:hypothetical protein
LPHHHVAVAPGGLRQRQPPAASNNLKTGKVLLGAAPASYSRVALVQLRPGTELQ